MTPLIHFLGCLFSSGSHLFPSFEVRVFCNLSLDSIWFQGRCCRVPWRFPCSREATLKAAEKLEGFPSLRSRGVFIMKFIRTGKGPFRHVIIEPSLSPYHWADLPRAEFDWKGLTLFLELDLVICSLPRSRSILFLPPSLCLNCSPHDPGTDGGFGSCSFPRHPRNLLVSWPGRFCLLEMRKADTGGPQGRGGWGLGRRNRRGVG